MEQTDDTLSRWRYFADCLREDAPVAEYYLINDSQTRRLLAAIFERFEAPTIVDYGCGALRYLYALLSQHSQRNWRYIGVDLLPTNEKYPEALQTCESFLEQRGRWQLETISSFRRGEIQADVALLVNVVHELPIGALAASVEDIRRHLKQDGVLALMDTGFVPEGEPRFVPIVESDLAVLMNGGENLSYVSKSGIPIVFQLVPRSSIPLFLGQRHVLLRWMSMKRDELAVVAVAGIQGGWYQSSTDRYGLKQEHVFNFLYLNTIVANATYRLIEEVLRPEVAQDEFTAAGRALIAFLMEQFEGTLLTAEAAFDRLSPDHSYEAIEAVIAHFARPTVPSLLMPGPLRIRGELMPTEAFDLLCDNLEEYGVFTKNCLSDALNDVYEHWHELNY